MEAVQRLAASSRGMLNRLASSDSGVGEASSAEGDDEVDGLIVIVDGLVRVNDWAKEISSVASSSSSVMERVVPFMVQLLIV